MKRKLIWLNILLTALIGAAVYKVRDEWTAQTAREQAIRRNTTKPAPPPVVPVAPAPTPVSPAAYGDIAQKMLFAKERNPNVVIEKPVEPPPKPMPPLPLLHGVMGLPSGMLALMSVNEKSRSVGLKTGEKIGEFELAALSPDEISLKWEDKTITKSVSEMLRGSQEKASSQQSPQPGSPAGPAAPVAGAAAAKPQRDVEGSAEAIKSCAPGDTSPSGTVADGYRKVLVATPFGNSCHWEQVK